MRTFPPSEQRGLNPSLRRCSQLPEAEKKGTFELKNFWIGGENICTNLKEVQLTFLRPRVMFEGLMLMQMEVF